MLRNRMLWILPLTHVLIALLLLSHLYLLRWSEWRGRDVVEQRYVEDEARAGRWPPRSDIGFEPEYFGPPREIAVLVLPDLPAIVIGGALVVPSVARDHLLEHAPGRMLPTTRMLIFIVLFGGLVAAQWYLITRIAARAFSHLVRRIVYIAPVLYVAVDLIVPHSIEEVLRVCAVIPWIIFAGWLLRWIWIFSRSKWAILAKHRSAG